MDSDIWGKHELQSEVTNYFSIGNLHIWLKIRDNEIWITHGYENELGGQPSKGPPPEKLVWARWANKSISKKIQILPVFPDLPLVVNSEYALKVGANTKIQIYTRVPVWVRISLAKNDYLLTELPIVTLSRTWFGSPIEGKLCYAATTKARRDLSKVEKKPYLVSCPILISNESYEELDFEHFCYRVERLSIYNNSDELWADETKIVYQGEDLHSEVTKTGKLPKGVQKSQLLSRPRKQVHKSLTTLTFRRLFKETHILGR